MTKSSNIAMEVSQVLRDFQNSSSLLEDIPGGLLTDNPFIGVPIAVILCMLCLLTFFGNAVVLHAIRTERRLQTVSNMFIMSLAVADLTVGLVVMPISSAYVLTGSWRFGLVVCQFWLSADYSASTASILNLLVLSLDRYWSISRPLEYLRRRSKKRALVVITFVWIGSFLWIVPIIGWHAFFRQGIRKQPSDVCETEFADNVVFKLTTSIINFYCPMVAMIVTYARIYHHIRKRALSEVMNRCSDIRPDSFSSSEPQPMRYALATQTPKSKRDKRRKKKDLQPSPDSEVVAKDGLCNQLPTACDANCDGVPAPPADAKWRCNMCGATQSNAEEWTYPAAQTDEIKKNERKSQSDEEISGDSSGDSSKKKRIRMSRKSRNPGKPPPSSIPNNISGHLRVPQSSDHLPPPTRSSSFRLLCNNATRGVLRRPSSRRSVASLRQETKAARQLGVIIGAFVLCWLPYMVLFVVTAACESCLGPGIHTAAIWLGYLNSTVNPLIYALCNASFKRAFWKIGAGFSAGWRRKCRGRETDHASENNPFA